MHGTLLWFNQTKEHGRINADDGEQLTVHRSGFRPGHVPDGRCAGTPVMFERIASGPEGEPRAVDVAVVEQSAQRRARRRSGGGFVSRR
jgi:cold shock CspA family protein